MHPRFGRLTPCLPTHIHAPLCAHRRQYVLELGLDGILHVVRDFLTQEGLYDCSWNEMNENQLVSASADGSIKLWDTLTSAWACWWWWFGVTGSTKQKTPSDERHHPPPQQPTTSPLRSGASTRRRPPAWTGTSWPRTHLCQLRGTPPSRSVAGGWMDGCGLRASPCRLTELDAPLPPLPTAMGPAPPGLPRHLHRPPGLRVQRRLEPKAPPTVRGDGSVMARVFCMRVRVCGVS